MRVGDIVVFNGEMTTVEEITLTYVVLAVWDGRRIMVPSSKMTGEPFENWTRRSPEMLGTVEWHVDWTIPVKLARKQLHHLLRSTDLWDGRTGVLQVSCHRRHHHDARYRLWAKCGCLDRPQTLPTRGDG